MTGQVLVFDTAPLNHFARAGELDTLRQIVTGYRCLTTAAVLDELRDGATRDARIADALNLDWLEEVRTDELKVLYAFARYMDVLGNDHRNGGEASVLAWVEVHGGVAYIDDQAGHNCARSRGINVRRTLNLILVACDDGLFDEIRAQELVNALVDEDARFPVAARHDLFEWAKDRGLWPLPRP